MPQNRSSWGPCLCQFSVLEWENEWRLCVVVSKYLCKVSGRPCFPATILSGIGRALSLIIILYACSHPNVRTGITSLIMSSWVWVFLPTFPRHVYAIPSCHTCLCVCSLEKRSLSSPAQPSVSINTSISSQERTRETESMRLSAAAGSLITNSIVLHWAIRLFGNFLVVTRDKWKVGVGICLL